MRLLVFTTLIIVSISTKATDYFGSRGPIARSLGGASLTISNPWSCFNNQASLAQINNFQIGAAATRVYNIDKLTIANIASAIPLKNGNATLGLSFDHFGITDLYALQRFGLSLSRFYGKTFAVGLQIEGLYLNMFDYGNKTMLNAHLGFLLLPSDKLKLGVQIQNLFGQVLIESIDERLPIIGRIGGSYKVHEKFSIYAEASFSTNRPSKLHSGILYDLNEKLALRGGFSTNELESSFGLDLKLKNVTVLLGFSYHQYLGTTPEMGMFYAKK
ncbi:MAG: hypothetical protein ACPGLV_05070 [Bacteroidia bacterium]